MFKGKSIGILFIVLGVIFLMNNLNIITVSLAEIIRVYWPVILIWIGIDKLDGNFLNEKSKLPFRENSIKYIYSSHFFEHISDDCAINLFKEVKRVLRADGLLRIVVPNFELLHYSLINEDTTLMKYNNVKICKIGLNSDNEKYMKIR